MHHQYLHYTKMRVSLALAILHYMLWQWSILPMSLTRWLFVDSVISLLQMCRKQLCAVWCGTSCDLALGDNEDRVNPLSKQTVLTRLWIWQYTNFRDLLYLNVFIVKMSSYCIFKMLWRYFVKLKHPKISQACATVITLLYIVFLFCSTSGYSPGFPGFGFSSYTL